jgi:membrane protease YdiL (CAAX protease family)
VTLALLGLLWGWLYERTGRLSVCILAHVLFNVVNLLSLPQG